MEKLGFDCSGGTWAFAAVGVGLTSFGFWLAFNENLYVPKEVDMIDTSTCKDFKRLGEYFTVEPNGKVKQKEVLIEGVIKPCEPDEVLRSSYKPEIEGVALVETKIRKESIFRPQDMAWYDKKITLSEKESVSSVSFLLVNKYDESQSVRIEHIHRADGFRDLLSYMKLKYEEKVDESKTLTFPIQRRELPLLLYPCQVFIKERIVKIGKAITVYGKVKPRPGRSSRDDVIVTPLHVSSKPLDEMIHSSMDPGIKRFAVFHVIVGLIFCGSAVVSMLSKSNSRSL